jgi:DNA-binding NtrC family response regulator
MTLYRARILLLVAEDSALAGALQSLLRDAGYEVVLATNPAAAQRLLREGAVDLALLDANWGAATVARLAEQAHTAAPPCPVGVMAGWWDSRAHDAAPWADALIYTPPTERQVFESLQDLLERAGRGRAVSPR